MTDAPNTTPAGALLPSWGSVLGAGLLGGVIAGVINALIWVILGRDIQVPEQGNADKLTDLLLPMVLFASIVPGLLAGIIAKIAVRSRARAGLVLGIVGLVGFLVSLGGPLTIKDAPGSDVSILIVMHLVAVISIIGMLLRRYRAA